MHQGQQHAFPINAYGGYTPQIDNEFTMIAINCSFLADILQFVGPGRNELALQDQLALVIVLDNGNLQHLDIPSSKSNRRAIGRNAYLISFQEDQNSSHVESRKC